MKRLNKIYGNCQVFSPKGVLMFLCLEKRANWYLKRNLAEVIGTDPLKIKLNFEPKGLGYDDPYYLSTKLNACVVCKEIKLENLTIHHIVPTEYRKHFPIEIKSRSSHDVVIMCQDHHYEYENNYAFKLKRELEKKYDIIPSKMLINKTKTNYAYNLAQMLMNQEICLKIPKERMDVILEKIESVFGHTDVFEISKKDINEIIENENLIIGKRLVEKIGNNIQDYQNFTQLWRQHFIDSMKPQFMPNGWSVDKPIIISKIY